VKKPAGKCGCEQRLVNCDSPIQAIGLRHAKYDLRKFGFTNTVMNTLNSLPTCVVFANTTKTLKTRFDKLGTIRIKDIYNFKA